MDNKLFGISVKPGMIVSVSTKGVVPSLIRAALGRDYELITGNVRRMCPTHTAIIVEYKNQLFIGDTVSPKSKLTTFKEYEDDIATGKRWNLQVFAPKAVSFTEMKRAADWWVCNVLGNPYDWPAFFRLSLKAVFGDIFPQAAGLEWAHWCTEGVKDAYEFGARVDVFKNENPTPLTVIKRWVLQYFYEVTR